jgi:hypothetical protein
MENLAERAKALLEKIPYITIATVSSEGNPHNSPVYAVHDERYNFFWNSSVESQHSKNIVANGKVAIVVYDSTVLEGQGFGVYIDGSAEELSGEALARALALFYAKKGKEPAPPEQFLPPSTRRMYIVTPKKIWVNTYEKGRTPPDGKEEVKIGQ